MINKFIKLIIGDLDEKHKYKQMMKRVDRLPGDYKFTFKKIQKYMYTVGAPNGDISIFNDLTMFNDLIELFEVSVADGREVNNIVGSDVGSFSNEFMNAYTTEGKTLKQKLNREIIENLNRGGSSND